MADLSGFDANLVKPNTGNIVPANEYDVVIINSELRPTAKGDGKYLKLEMQILNGPMQNRHLFDQLNLVNPNEETVQIARGTLSAICRAVGVMTPKDSAELHNKPLRVKVVVKKSDEYGAATGGAGGRAGRAGRAGRSAGRPATGSAAAACNGGGRQRPTLGLMHLRFPPGE